MINDDLNQIREVVREEIAVSEQRLKKEITVSVQRLITTSEQSLKKEIAASDSRVMADIGSFMEENLFPMIEEKADKSDIERLENKLDKVIDSNLDHGARIKDIEAVPAIAHQLRVKRSK